MNFPILRMIIKINHTFNIIEKKFGRNPKCDRDWIKVQRKKGNKSPKRKGKIKVQRKREIEVQREKGNKNPNRKGK